MRKMVTFFVILTVSGCVVAGCATMSDEERCRKEGGAWNNNSKMCERQAK